MNSLDTSRSVSPSAKPSSRGTVGQQIHLVMSELFPLCRSLTGDGVRQTLERLRKVAPLQTASVATGTKCFDWEVPAEWNVKDAYVKNSRGERVIDFKKNNLHLVSYSVPFKGSLSLKELQAHLHSIPEQPQAIPYITSYYERRWGFCLSHEAREALPEDTYEVVVDTSLTAGVLNYGELAIPGETTEEILFSANVCHPSLANNELSGPVLLAHLAAHVATLKNRHFSYRFVWVPETIGALAFLSRSLPHLKKNVVAGYTVTCVGGTGPLIYLQTPGEHSLSDRAALKALENSGFPYETRSFLLRGSDERQYNWPGIDLNVGSVMKAKYGEYPEYHTSLDNLDYVRPEALQMAFQVYESIVEILEANRIYRVTTLGEPQLGKRGLYPTLSSKKSDFSSRFLLNLLALSDGRIDLMSLAAKLKCSFQELAALAKTCEEHGILEAQPFKSV